MTLHLRFDDGRETAEEVESARLIEDDAGQARYVEAKLPGGRHVLHPRYRLTEYWCD